MALECAVKRTKKLSMKLWRVIVLQTLIALDKKGAMLLSSEIQMILKQP